MLGRILKAFLVKEVVEIQKTEVLTHSAANVHRKTSSGEQRCVSFLYCFVAVVVVVVIVIVIIAVVVYFCHGVDVWMCGCT